MIPILALSDCSLKHLFLFNQLPMNCLEFLFLGDIFGNQMYFVEIDMPLICFSNAVLAYHILICRIRSTSRNQQESSNKNNANAVTINSKSNMLFPYNCSENRYAYWYLECLKTWNSSLSFSSFLPPKKWNIHEMKVLSFCNKI